MLRLTPVDSFQFRCVTSPSWECLMRCVVPFSLGRSRTIRVPIRVAAWGPPADLVVRCAPNFQVD